MKSNLRARHITIFVIFVIFLVPFSATAESNIVLVGEYEANEAELLDLNVKDGIAYALTQTPGNFELTSLDVARPARIVELDSVHLLGKDMRNVLIKDDIAYIGSLYGFYIVDISNPSDMKVIWDYCTAEHLNGLEFQIKDNHVFIVTFNGYIEIADISDPGLPSLTSRIIMPSREYRAIHVDGQYAYATYTENGTVGVSAFDLNDPANPILTGNLELTIDETSSLYAVSGLIYVAGTDTDEAMEGARDNVILVIDATDPSSLSLVSSTVVSKSANADSSKLPIQIVHSPWVLDGHIFLMETNGSLKILENEPSDPVQIGEFNGVVENIGTDNPMLVNSFFVEESRALAYVVTDDTIYVLDISTYAERESFISRYWWVPVTIVTMGIIVVSLRMTSNFARNAKSHD
jgi:hypothetical protein